MGVSRSFISKEDLTQRILKSSKASKKFTFVHFLNVDNLERLIENVCTIWMGHFRLHTNPVRFQREFRAPNSQPNKGNLGVVKNSFASILKSNNYNDTAPSNSSPAIVMDDSCIVEKDLSYSLMGKIKDITALSNLYVILADEGFDNITLSYLGRFWVLINAGSVTFKEKLINHMGVASWFSELCPPNNSFVSEDRLVWNSVEGLPMIMWNNKALAKIISQWGTLSDVEDVVDASLPFKKCMRTRSSSNLPVESSPNPTTSNPKRRNRRRSKQPFILKESLVDMMADQCTMEELLRAPTEGYTKAIMVPPILAEQFELKHRAARRWLPSRTTNLRNEISNFQQRFDESFHEAWDRYKDLLRACPHHGFTELHQLDTFYNALNLANQDSLNSAAGGNLLERRTQDVLAIIENKSKQTRVVTTAMTAILKQFQATPPPASVKAVEEICVTYGGAHLYYQCLAACGNTFLELQDNIQRYVSAAAVNYNQVVPLSELEKIKRMNEANMKGMQTQINNVKNELRNEMKNSIQAFMSNQTNELKNMMASFFQMNTASTSGSGHLPSNTIANPKGELKAITTRSALLSNKEKLLELANTPLNENCSAVILKKLPEKLGDPGKFLNPCGFSELNCKALADLDVFVPVGKFTFPADFVIVDYKSDPRVPLILGRPFLQTAHALIDVHREKMILHDGDERLTLNMRHDTSSYSNQPQKESINMINIYDDSSEDFLEDLFAINHQSGNPTFSSHPELTSLEVKDDVFDPEGGNVLIEKFLDLDSTKDVHPLIMSIHQVAVPLLHLLQTICLRSSPMNSLLSHFHWEMMIFRLELVDEDNLADLYDNLADTMPELFTDEHALDYSSPLLYDEYDDDLFKVESDTEYIYNDPFDSKGEKIKESKLLIDELNLPRSSNFLPSSEYDSFLSEDYSEVDALPSINNEDKVFNPGILIQENLSKVNTRIVPDKNVKKLAISHTSLMLEDFDPPLYELPFFKEVPGAETLLSFSFENEEKVFKPGILTSKGVHSSLFSELSHRGYKVFIIIKILKSPMEIFLFSHGEDIRILDVPCNGYHKRDKIQAKLSTKQKAWKSQKSTPTKSKPPSQTSQKKYNFNDYSVDGGENNSHQIKDLDHVSESRCMKQNDEFENQGNVNKQGAQSADPFGNYGILNRNQDKEKLKEDSKGEGPTFPPGFTLIYVNDKDLVEIRQTMGYNMEGCLKNIEAIVGFQENIDLFSIKALWGNFSYDFAYSHSLRFSGGILCVWDLNMFSKDNVTISDSFLAVRGECVILGDFNEVRSDHDSFGTIFNDSGAKTFNHFISSTGLIDLPLEGYSYTWALKSASKMSKVVRFFIFEGLLSGFSSLSALCLDRHLSDHRPNIMREFLVDYGPSPFRVFHSWVDKDGFDKLVEDSWKNLSFVEAKKISLLWKKFQALKAIDKLFDKGKSNDVLVNERTSLLKDLHDINAHHSLDMAQKAKIRWSIKVDADWIDEPTKVENEFLNHFSNHFSKPSSPDITLDTQMFKQISFNQNEELESGVTYEEIKRPKIIDAVHEFFVSSKFPPRSNSSFITLIPKKQDEKVKRKIEQCKGERGCPLFCGNPSRGWLTDISHIRSGSS
nr:hypothetical protein [Tanacetum cinerariifolium]